MIFFEKESDFYTLFFFFFFPVPDEMDLDDEFEPVLSESGVFLSHT